jgi:hypothetical protein
VFTTVLMLFGLVGVAAVSAGPDGGGGSGKDCPASSPGGQAVPPRQAPNCGHPGDPVVPENCTNNADDDGDGLVDDEDTDCPIGTEGPFGDPSCSDGRDNDGDTFVDAADPDCVPVTPGNRCDNPGLLTNPTLGETLSKAGLDALSPIIDDPEGDDGAVSTPLGDAVGGILGQKAGDDVACAVDLIIEETATGGADV